jgi:hypothetical protein
LLSLLPDQSMEFASKVRIMALSAEEPDGGAWTVLRYPDLPDSLSVNATECHTP